jgi:choline dehydrogenase-like flavoprotein
MEVGMSTASLDDRRAGVVEVLCEAIVPGSARVGPAVYIDALLMRMPEPDRAATLVAIDSLADAAGDPDALAERALTPEFLQFRALAVEAFYSDFVAPGASGPGAWEEIDFNTPLAMRLNKDWSYLGVGAARSPGVAHDGKSSDAIRTRGRRSRGGTPRFDVAVVGSGAGGGLIAGELAQRGRKVVLLEAGPHRTAADFTRWEAHAMHDIWWPFRQAFVDGGAGGVIPLLGGRCVGGTTTINTKVALRAHARDLAKWHAVSGLTGDGGEPFGIADLQAHYERVEQVLGVRERADWPDCVCTVDAGFRALGSKLKPVDSYTDANCMKCGSCLQGCPTNAGKSTMTSYIHPAWAAGQLDVRPEATVERVLIEPRDGAPEATGVEYVDAAGERHVVEADAVVVAAGALNTPQVLIRSGVAEASGWSDSSRLIGGNLGLHPARLVYGFFDEPQDAHMVYPITSHCMDFQHDEDGGFVIEAATVQDPIGFAVSLGDERGPLWGTPLVEAARGFRNCIGVLAMANDHNNGAVVVEDTGGERFDAHFEPVELERIERSLDFSRRVLEAAGAKRVLWTGLVSAHAQGTCRMGSDPTRSVVDAHGESHDAKRLFVGDSSVIPRTLSVNPSLTIMALADRLAEHLDADPRGYLQAARGAGAVSVEAGR